MDRIEAIILSSAPFRERDSLLTLFSVELGLIKGVMHGMNRLKSGFRPDPLSQVEFLIQQGRSDLHRIKDGVLISPLLHLRESYELLEAAGMMGQAVLATQQPQKPAPDLYHLFVYLLNKLPLAAEPSTLVTLFQLRLLKHEGLWSIDHLPFPIDPDERRLLEILVEEKQFEKICGLCIPEQLRKNIETLQMARHSE